MSTNILKGLGNDIIEVERIQKALNQHGKPILDKLFTPKEQAYCSQFANSFQRFAGRFAAKEAIVKALGLGIGKEVSWHDLEILNDPKGKPYVTFSDKIKNKYSDPQFLISISHTEKYANAIAIWL